MQAKSDERSGRYDKVPLGFGDLLASPGDHIGHFYQTREEWRNLVVPFLKAGLQGGEKCVYHVIPGGGKPELQAALASADIDVDGVLESEQLILTEGKDTPTGMQDLLRSVLAEIPEKYPLLRWGGDMTWALKKLPSSEELMQWETHCNTVDNPRAVFLCQYDLNTFSGNVVMDALRTHPVCVVSEAIHKNPIYETPEAFLGKLRLRSAQAGF